MVSFWVGKPAAGTGCSQSLAGPAICVPHPQRSSNQGMQLKCCMFVAFVQRSRERLQHSAAHSMAAPPSVALVAAGPPCSGSHMQASRTPQRSWCCMPPPASWPHSCRWCSCSWQRLACPRSCCCPRTAGVAEQYMPGFSCWYALLNMPNYSCTTDCCAKHACLLVPTYCKHS